MSKGEWENNKIEKKILFIWLFHIKGTKNDNILQFQISWGVKGQTSIKSNSPCKRVSLAKFPCKIYHVFGSIYSNVHIF